MRVFFKGQGEYKKKCEQIGEALGLDLSKHEARVYPNVSYDINDICMGLKRLYAHKKQAFYVKHQDPHVEDPMKSLAKEGLSVKPLEFSELQTPDAFIDSLERESHFLIYSVDNPLLGKLNDFSKFEEAIKDKTFFRVRVSYNQHRFQGIPKPERNIVHCLGLPNGMAVVLMGERVRYPSQGVEKLDWSELDVSSCIEVLKNGEEDRARVEKFESNTELGFKPFFKPEEGRIFDRAVVCWNDIDSAAVIEYLAKDDLKPAGSEARFESLSLSRWGGLRTMDWLLEQGYTHEEIRGLLVVSVSELTDGFEKNVADVRKQIMEAQGHAE